MIGRMDSPKSLKAYSTRGGTSGNTVLVMMPSSSMDLRLSVSTFWLIPSRYHFIRQQQEDIFDDPAVMKYREGLTGMARINWLKARRGYSVIYA